MRMPKSALLASLMLFSAAVFAAGGEGAGQAADWKSWRAGNDVENLASLQRGARNFMSYCSGCHSLKYMRYSRLGKDLGIPEDQLEAYLVPADAKPTDYVLSNMPAADAEAWFGTVPPDLSLIARSRGTDYLFQFLKTFYVDPSRPTGVDNLALAGTAMPHVLAELEGLKRPVYRNVERQGENGPIVERVFDHFEQVTPGRMSAEEYDTFVRDIVNFLDYVGEPHQAARRSLGVWVVLFLLAFTWLAWLMKKEYWKDVH